jgi:hypothetical protein
LRGSSAGFRRERPDALEGDQVPRDLWSSPYTNINSGGGRLAIATLKLSTPLNKGSGDLVAISEATGQVDWGRQTPVLALRRGAARKQRRLRSRAERRCHRAFTSH